MRTRTRRCKIPTAEAARRWPLIALLCVGALMLAGWATVEPVLARDHSCKPRAAKLRAADGRTRIWFVAGGSRGGYYACYGRRRKPVFLGDAVGGAGIFRLSVAGRYVVYESRFCDPARPVCGGQVVMRDLRQRRVRASVIPDGQNATEALAITRRGGAAWIRGTNTENGFEVRIRDGSGERIVGAGADIDSASLAVNAARVYWTQGEFPRSAPLGAW